MEFESFYIQHTHGEVNHEDGQVPKPSAWDDIFGVGNTSMVVDPSSVNGETELNAFMRLPALRLLRDSLAVWGL